MWFCAWFEIDQHWDWEIVIQAVWNSTYISWICQIFVGNLGEDKNLSHLQNYVCWLVKNRASITWKKHRTGMSCRCNDGASKENLHLDYQSEQVVSLLFAAVFSKRNRIVSANCEHLQWYRFAPRVKVSQLQKKRIENHLSQPTSMTFWTARETNREEYCLWLAHFSSLSDTLSSCVWSTDPVFLIQHRFSVKCPSYLFFGITKPKSRKRNFSIWKMVKLKLSCRSKNQLVVSCQVMTNQCYVCGFVSHLIGCETINIPEIFSGVHSFTGKIVLAYCQTYLGMLPQMLHN